MSGHPPGFIREPGFIPWYETYEANAFLRERQSAETAQLPTPPIPPGGRKAVPADFGIRETSRKHVQKRK